MPLNGDLGRDDALVDADDAVFEGLGDAPDAADVAAVEIGGEAELGVVGHLDRIGFALEAVERASSLAMTRSVVTSVSAVGSKKVPPYIAPAAGDDLKASAICASTFSTPACRSAA